MKNSPPHPQRRIIRRGIGDRDRNSLTSGGTNKRRKRRASTFRGEAANNNNNNSEDQASGASSRRTSDASGYYDYSNDDDDDDDFRRGIGITSSNIKPRKISRESSDAESGNSKSNANNTTTVMIHGEDQSSAAAQFSNTNDNLKRDYDFAEVPTLLTQNRGNTEQRMTIPAAVTPVKNPVKSVIDNATFLDNDVIHSPDIAMDDSNYCNHYNTTQKPNNERDRRHSMESFMSIASDLTESEWEQQQHQQQHHKRHDRTRPQRRGGGGGGGGHRMETTGPVARRRNNIRPPSSPNNNNSDSGGGGGGGGIFRPPSPFRDGTSLSAAASPSSPAARVIANGIDAIDGGRTWGVSVERQISTPPSSSGNMPVLPMLLTNTDTSASTTQVTPSATTTPTNVAHARTVRRHNRSATMLGDLYAMNAIQSLQMYDDDDDIDNNDDDDYDDEEHKIVPVSQLRRQYKPQQRGSNDKAATTKMSWQQQQQQERRSSTQHYQQPNPSTTKRKGGNSGVGGGGSKQNMKRNNLVIQLPEQGFGQQRSKQQQQKLSSRLPPTHPLSNSISPQSAYPYNKSKQQPYHGYSNSTGSIMSETSSAAESEVTPRISQVGRGRGGCGRGWIGEGGGGSGGRNEGGWVERYQQNRTKASLTFSFSEDDDDDNYGIEVNIDDDKSDSVLGDDMMDEGPVITQAKEKKQSQKFSSKRPRPIPIQIPFNELKGIDISFSRKDEHDAAARMTSSEYQNRTRTSSDKDHPLLDYKVNDLSPIKAEIYTNEDDYSNDDDEEEEEADHEGNHTRQFSSDDRFFEGIHDSGLQSLSFEQVADDDLKTCRDVEIELVYNTSGSFGCHETDEEESDRNSEGINSEKANLKRILQWRKGRHAWMMGRQQEQSNDKNHEMEGTSEYDDLELTQFRSLTATGRGNIGNHSLSAFTVCSDGRPKSSRPIDFGHDNCYDADDGSEVRSLTSSAGASTPKSLRFPDSTNMCRRYGFRKLSSPRILLLIFCLVLTAGILMNINFEERNNQSYAAEENGLWQEEDQGPLTFPGKRSKNLNDDDNNGKDDYFESSTVKNLVIDDQDSYELADDSVIVKNIASVVSSKSDVQPARDFNKFVGIDTISVMGVCERHPSIDWLVNRLKKLYPDMVVMNELPTTTDDSVTKSEVDAHQTSKGHILVIAVSVNPYAWVELMRVDSQHDSIYSPVENDNDRGNLGWEDYVKSILPSINGTILDLRANSIYSAVVESGQHDGVRAVIPLQFEDLVEPYSNYDNFISDESLSLPGIVGLMDQIQAQTGLHVDELSGWHVAVKDKNDFWADPIGCTGNVCFPSVNKMIEDKHFIRYMNEHIDWSMEELMGYYPRHEPKD